MSENNLFVSNNLDNTNNLSDECTKQELREAMKSAMDGFIDHSLGYKIKPSNLPNGCTVEDVGHGLSNALRPVLDNVISK